MTSRLRKAFIDNLKSADWMDFETQQSAKEKVQALSRKFIGRLIISLVQWLVYRRHRQALLPQQHYQFLDLRYI